MDVDLVSSFATIFDCTMMLTWIGLSKYLNALTTVFILLNYFSLYQTIMVVIIISKRLLLLFLWLVTFPTCEIYFPENILLTSSEKSTMFYVSCFVCPWLFWHATLREFRVLVSYFTVPCCMIITMNKSCLYWIFMILC